ncbi:MAG: ABC transporter ATP-binding protein [Desulfobacterales bacterium]|jgi:tungstate transport system ATP-binding protein
MSLYAARRLKKKYAHRTVLDLPELTIEAGGMVALLGPNGAGKTTLLHILAFLLPPSSGRLWFKTRAVAFDSKRLHHLRRQAVLVEQHPIMFSTTVAQNVAFGLKLRGLTRREIDHRVDESLEMVGMRPFAKASGCHLSGGETQRVAIARAVACRPQVILLDEPTSNVDPENRLTIEAIMGDIRVSGHSSVIFCTHDFTQAARLTPIRLHLAAGRLNGADYENTFQTRVRRVGDHYRGCIGDALEIPLPPTEATHLRVAINPHRVIVSAVDPHRPAWESCRGRVIQLLEDHDGVRLMLDIGVPLAIVLPSPIYRALNPRIGDMLQVQCPPDALCLLEDGLLKS